MPRTSLNSTSSAAVYSRVVDRKRPTKDQMTETHEDILARLRKVVVDSAANDRQLPTERELCQQLGVSRTTLREHLQALEVVGLLRRDQGRGTFLQAPDGVALGNLLDLALVADDVSASDLTYVRRILERESAALSCGRLSDDDHARMTGLCAQMRAPLPAQHIAAADHDFHMVLLQRSGNAALALLGATLSQSLHRSMLSMRVFIASDRRTQLEMARAHERILDAVVANDADRAWKEMDHHFVLSERIARRIVRRGATTSVASDAESDSDPISGPDRADR